MDRRELYLEAGLGLFLERGFAGTSMDELVAVAGGSKATLYRYFDSKEQLFQAIIADLSDRSAPPLLQADLSSISLEDGLRLLARATATAALSQRAVVLLRLALGEYGRFPDLATALFENGPGVGYARLRAFISARREQGMLDVADVQIAAEQFLGGIVGHQQLRMALGVGQPTAPDIDRRIEAAVSTFVAAYGRVKTDRPPPPSPRQPRARPVNRTATRKGK